jgi:hypothetical protein
MENFPVSSNRTRAAIPLRGLATSLLVNGRATCDGAANLDVFDFFLAHGMGIIGQYASSRDSGRAKEFY